MNIHDATEIAFRNGYEKGKAEVENEVERLTNILNSYALQYGTVMDKHIVIERARTEVAREIFEEIEKIKKEYASGDIDGNELYVRLYLLEKKYTEDINHED